MKNRILFVVGLILIIALSGLSPLQSARSTPGAVGLLPTQPPLPGWRWRGGGDFNAASFGDASHAWVVGDTIVASSDGGRTWIGQIVPTGHIWYGVWAANAQRIWTVGSNGGIAATLDGGATWITQTSGVNYTLYSVAFLDSMTGVAAGEGGTVLSTVDGGLSWRSENSSAPSNACITSVNPAGPNDVWIAGSLRGDCQDGGSAGYIVAHGVRNGSTFDWTTTRSSLIQQADAVGFFDPRHGLLVANSSPPAVVRTEDGGGNWRLSTIPVISAAHPVYSLDQLWVRRGSQQALLLGTLDYTDEPTPSLSQALWASHDGGVTWAGPTLLNSGNDPRTLASWDGSAIVLAGYLGLISASNDGGQNFQRVSPATGLGRFDPLTGQRESARASAVQFLSDTSGWIISQAATDCLIESAPGCNPAWLLRTSDGFNFSGSFPANKYRDPISGVEFSADPLSDIQFVNDQTGWAVGIRVANRWDLEQTGAILETGDGGQSWKPAKLAVNTHLAGKVNGISAIDASHAWAAGCCDLSAGMRRDQGFIWKLASDGKWSIIYRTAIPGPNFRDISFATLSRGWVVGDSGTILASIDGGNTWITQTSNADVSLLTVHALAGDRAWAAGENGVILYTEDGTTWHQAASPVDSAITKLYFLAPNNGWATSSDGIILHSSDGGHTWQIENSSTSLKLNSIHMTNPGSGWAVGDHGLLLHYGGPLATPTATATQTSTSTASATLRPSPTANNTTETPTPVKSPTPTRTPTTPTATRTSGPSPTPGPSPTTTITRPVGPPATPLCRQGCRYLPVLLRQAR